MTPFRDDTAYIATQSGYTTRLVGLSEADRLRHVYVIGKTGFGKTALLRNLLVQDIIAGRGVGLIDPHGDLAEELLEHIPPSRADHLVYLNAGDRAHPIGLNPLRAQNADDAHRAASTMVAVFKHLWGHSWGARLEYILFHALGLVARQGNLTLLAAHRLLSDEDYRGKLLARAPESVHRSFWLGEFARWDKRMQSDAVVSVQNKLGRIVGDPVLRAIFGQVKSRIDLGFMMDNQRILIANLAKGRIGEEAANLLGSTLVTLLEHAVWARADRSEDERTPFFLFIDEFQNFTTDSFSAVFSEARKYGLSVTVAHQYLDQLGASIQSAVLANAGTLVAFGVSPGDAERIVPFFAPTPAEQLVDLGRGEVYIRMQDEGRSVSPFRAKTLPPLQLEPFGRRENLIRHSRERFARPQKEVDARLRRWQEG